MSKWIDALVKERSERINTMITLQSFLFAAIAFAWDKSDALPLALATVGVVASVSFAVYVQECDRDLSEVAKIDDGDTERGWHPKSHGPSSFFGPVRVLELSFGIAWGAIWVVALAALSSQAAG